MPSRLHELSPEEVLMVAIDVEEVNGARLRNFAGLFADDSSDSAKVFATMADEEDEHRIHLEAVYTRRYGKVRRTVGQEDVQEVIEAHERPSGEPGVTFRAERVLREVAVITAEDLGAMLETEGPDSEVGDDVSDGLSLRQALDTVLAAELRAHDFYELALRQTADPDQQALFRRRGEFEGQHVQWMKTRLDALEEP